MFVKYICLLFQISVMMIVFCSECLENPYLYRNNFQCIFIVLLVVFDCISYSRISFTMCAGIEMFAKYISPLFQISVMMTVFCCECLENPRTVATLSLQFICAVKEPSNFLRVLFQFFFFSVSSALLLVIIITTVATIVCATVTITT